MKKEFEFSVNGVDYKYSGLDMQVYKKNNNHNESYINQVIPANKPCYLRTIALTLNNKCNLSCSYCYANKGSWDIPGIRMSFEIAKKSIDLLIESNINNNGKFITISFFGGEPLLDFDLIQDIVEYAKSKLPSKLFVRFALVTNGTLINMDISDYLSKNKFIISYSLDGDKNNHDKCRKYLDGSGSYDDVVSNIKHLYELPVLIRTTVSNHNFLIEDVVKHVVGLNQKIVVYELDEFIDPKLFSKHIKSCEKLIQNYILDIKNGQYYDIRNISRILASILLKKYSRTHCNAGTGYLAISADGKMYLCHRFIGIGEASIGNVLDLNSERIQNYINHFASQVKSRAGERDDVCNECSFESLCGGMCFYQAYKSGGDYLKRIPKFCSFKKNVFIQTLKFMCSLEKDDFNKYINFLISLWNRENRNGELCAI